jgi:hypothetical protein
MKFSELPEQFVMDINKIILWSGETDYGYQENQPMYIGTIGFIENNEHKKEKVSFFGCQSFNTQIFKIVDKQELLNSENKKMEYNNLFVRVVNSGLKKFENKDTNTKYDFYSCYVEQITI